MMPANLNNKKKKIEFLKGILSGTRNLNELLPFKSTEIILSYEVNGITTYLGSVSGKEYTETEIESLKEMQSKRNWPLIIFQLEGEPELSKPPITDDQGT